MAKFDLKDFFNEIVGPVSHETMHHDDIHADDLVNKIRIALKSGLTIYSVNVRITNLLESKNKKYKLKLSIDGLCQHDS